jgi:hypothetical protein
MIMNKNKIIQIVALLLLGAVIGFHALQLSARISEDSSTDGLQNLRAAYNLAYHGVISQGEEMDGPSNYREPLPIIFLAAHIKSHPLLTSGQTLKTINEGKAIAAVKQHNLFWAVLCMVGVAITVVLAIPLPTGGFITAIPAVYLTKRLFLQGPSIIDQLYTEIQAATLLVWASVTLIAALKTMRPVWYFLTGAVLGALALTKALFLYGAAGLMFVLLAAYLVRVPIGGRLKMVQLIGWIGVGLTVIVAPWIARNYYHFNAFTVSERGGIILLTRAIKNQMNSEELRGAFFAYSPAVIRTWIGERLGFSSEDLRQGGRLQRLDRESSAERDLEAERLGRPEDAVSFYRSARAERVAARSYWQSQGVDNPGTIADNELQRKAVHMIIADPVDHLRTTPAFLWRGIWAIDSQSVSPEFAVLFNALAFVALVGMGLGGLSLRNAWMSGVAAMSVVMIILYAIASHFIPRYAAPMIPNMIIAFVLVVQKTLVLLVVWSDRDKRSSHGIIASHTSCTRRR